VEYRKFNVFLHRVARLAPDIGHAPPESPYGSSSLSQ
jgi:hypothetical protein